MDTSGEVAGAAEVPGALPVERAVAVGFQTPRCLVGLKVAPDTEPRLVEKLVAAAETGWVNLQTPRPGAPVEMQPILG